MDIKVHHTAVTKTARYATYGHLTKDTKFFWFALHGTKMQCEQVLYKFSDFDPNTHFILAPEGLSRFYLKGFGGDVVATWMTKRDRLEEISDFSKYLSHLYLKHTAQLSPNSKKIILGFSQGGTTAFRWLHDQAVDTDHLIAYSSWIPEDIDLKQSKTDLQKLKCLFTYGEQDQFLTPDRISAVKQVILKNQLDIQMLPYEGEHKIDRKQLMHLFESQVK